MTKKKKAVKAEKPVEMAKPELVEKVSKETGVEEVDLDRLPVDALDKLDDLVPDEDEVVEDEIDIFSEDEQKEPETKPDESQEADPAVVVEEASNDVGGKRVVGYHPITKEPVYK